jgi:single-strand DNA-binding protein
MSSFNKVILMGNLTRDPEVRYTPSGSAVTELDMAINRRFKKSDGQSGEETCYVNRITVWGRQAETCGQYLKRGAPVLVEGRLRYDQWEKDGQKHSRLGVVAERVQFLGSPSKGSEFQDGGAASAAAVSQNNSVGGSVPPPQPPVVNDGGVAKTDPLTDDEDNLPF